MQDRFGQLQKCFEQKKEYFMINRTKIFTIALTGALAAVALTGCGGSASSSAAPSSVSTAAAESPASSAAASGSGLGMSRGMSRAFLAMVGARSKVPPTPTPTMMGGQGFGPACLTVSSTKSLIPLIPLDGANMAQRDMFSAPPPLGRKRMRNPSPATRSRCRDIGVLSPVLARVRGWHMELRRYPLA